MSDLKAGCLYIVGTPIGNLGDISARAAKTLSDVDFIAAEDTRVTRKLLSHLSIHTPLVSYHEHNRIESGAMIVARLQNGESAALVTDAGMPAISDPGQELVSMCAEAGVNTVVVPGACALVCALALSGLPMGRFCFEGFLSTASRRRKAHLDQLRHETRTMVFYEAPHKLFATLSDLYKTFGDRNIVLAREMTKCHEEVLRITLSQAVERYTGVAPRGEFVLVVSGAEPPAPADRSQEALELARGYLDDGLSVRDAARRAALETGVPRGALYSHLLEDRKV